MTRSVMELRFALSLNPMPIYILGFAEAERVNLSSADPFNLKRSAGFGMRILLNPIGAAWVRLWLWLSTVGTTGAAPWLAVPFSVRTVIAGAIAPVFEIIPLFILS